MCCDWPAPGSRGIVQALSQASARWRRVRACEARVGPAPSSSLVACLNILAYEETCVRNGRHGTGKQKSICLAEDQQVRRDLGEQLRSITPSTSEQP